MLLADFVKFCLYGHPLGHSCICFEWVLGFIFERCCHYCGIVLYWDNHHRFFNLMKECIQAHQPVVFSHQSDFHLLMLLSPKANRLVHYLVVHWFSYSFMGLAGTSLCIWNIGIDHFAFLKRWLWVCTWNYLHWMTFEQLIIKQQLKSNHHQ